MAIKLKKTLYVGIGGTGVATLLRVKKNFIDSYGKIPPMIGFLAIDTDNAALNKDVTSNRGKSIKLEKSELYVVSVHGANDVYQKSPKNFDWIPRENVGRLSVIAGTGAGQVRSNGRFIAAYNYTGIQTNITNAVNNILQALPANSEFEYDTNMNGVQYPVNVNVFASVAGGSGSGMLIDVLSLINATLSNLALNYNLYPWLFLPEVFRAMSTGPAMANVLYNTYGALNCLDYIQQLDVDKTPVDFNHTIIKDKLFNYAYVINNLNRAGISFDRLDDLADVVAKCAFLPANKMGDELQSPFDNIVASQAGGVYDILGKKAWAASAGSSELIYDSTSVGQATAFRIISQLCDSMCCSVGTGLALANAFVDHQDVKIRENDGRDDVIDAILDPNPSYDITVDLETDVNKINLYVDDVAGNKAKEEAKERFALKLAKTKEKIKEKVADILNNTQHGCLGTAVNFIESLEGIMKLCNGEMEEEMKVFNDKNQIPADYWNAYLNSLEKRTFLGFGKSLDQDNADLLQGKVREYVINRREEIRRSFAINFYNSIFELLGELSVSLTNLKNTLDRIKSEQNNKLIKLQQLSASTSLFQIYLHKDDVYSVSEKDFVDDNVRAAFHKYFNDKGGVDNFLNLSHDKISEELWDFAETTDIIQNILEVTIEDVLRNLPQTTVESLFSRLRDMSSPLWSINTQGFNTTALELDKFVILGVPNRDNTLLITDDRYKGLFDTPGHSANFASTNQRDRISVLVVENLVPIYAVNNFSVYKADYEQKIANKTNLSCFVDGKLKSRMDSENFSLLPTVGKDNTLELWVLGFIFEYIHFDEDAKVYWMKSKRKGEPIAGYRYNLSPQRDVAYDKFKTEGLSEDIEEAINEMKAEKGNAGIEQKIGEIKTSGDYYEKYSQLSSLERAQIRDSKFVSVYNLINNETKLMSN